MTIKHHPTGSTLISYVSGSLPAALSGLVACHVSLCSQCDHAVRRLEAVGGLLLEAAGGEHPISEAGLRRAMQLSAGIDIDPAPLRPKVPADPVLPTPLVRYLGMGSDEIPWRRLIKGLEQYKVKLPRGGGEMRLLRARPRLRLLAHSHRGMELTLVLTGSYQDKTGRYNRGDVSDLAEGIEHQPKVLPDAECICIIASERPARYSDLIPRLLGPVMGF